jgi:hypothetical protein
MRLTSLSRVYKRIIDLKIVPGESRSQGSQNRIYALGQDEESVTEYQGSQNEPLWELKWPLSACSGWPCRVLRSGSATIPKASIRYRYWMVLVRYRKESILSIPESILPS